MIPRRWPILIGMMVGVSSLVTAVLIPASAKSLFDLKGGDGELVAGGQKVKVAIQFLCPKDENVSNGGPGVVIDVSLTQEDKLGRTIEGEAESVPVICTDKWREKVITVTRDPANSTGPVWVAGKASEKAVMDDNGVDVASTPTGKDGSMTVHLR